jgi:hypothetical protein
MNLQEKSPRANFMVAVQCVDRWRVYYRLQELEISCHCGSYQPLMVEISSVAAIIQVWSVVKRTNTSRVELADWLETCWLLTDSGRR